ncbi:MAG: DUF177 domain-containing protein [Oscillospiraceae bacterium]|nr:DUF177 domain-containing protein [Oscillospiraceae bacterium]
MLLKLKPLFDGEDGERPVEIDIPQSDMDKYKGVGEFITPVTLRGKTVCRAGIVTLSYNLDYTVSHICDRCLAEFTRRYNQDYTHILVRGDEDNENLPDDDEYVYCSGETLDLNELAISDLLLSVPTKILCREDCKGICPTCGKNLNDGDCDCESDQ